MTVGLKSVGELGSHGFIGKDKVQEVQKSSRTRCFSSASRLKIRGQLRFALESVQPAAATVFSSWPAKISYGASVSCRPQAFAGSCRHLLLVTRRDDGDDGDGDDDDDDGGGRAR